VGTHLSGFGEFVIESPIGEGGMGKVFRARQVTLDRWVALKVLAKAADNKDFVQRFYREARSAARLVHPNIIQIYTVGEHQGVPFFAMEYVDGLDLQRLMQNHPDRLTVEETVEIIRSVAKALVIGLEHAVVHRDIKPGNIMITRSGLVKVMDFGLAKSPELDHATTQSGVIVGTPAYMSPEQGAGRAVDSRSDIYSLGCVLYECLADRPPFDADNVASLIYKHGYEAPTRPTEFHADIPAELEQVCLRMLAKDPDERYQSPEDLLMGLAEVPCRAGLGEMLLGKRVASMVRGKKRESTTLKRNSQSAAVIIKPSRPSGISSRKSRIIPMRPAVDQDAAMARATTVDIPVSPPVPQPPAARADPGAAEPLAAVAPVAGAAEAGVDDHLAALNEAAPSFPTEDAPPSPAPVLERVGLLGLAPAAPAPAPAPAAPVPAPASDMTAVTMFRQNFERLPDGRWSYRASLGPCRWAEGLAAKVPAPANEMPHGLGDCLLCPNWSRRVGCAYAYSFDLELRKRYEGLGLRVEQALAWIGADRHDEAIALLDNYIRAQPDDPDGYRELARVYDRPDYHGRDRRRAAVLYQRFAALARANGKFTPVEIARAEERAKALGSASMSWRPTPRKDTLPFQCLYRGADTCLVYGVLTASRMVLAHAGNIDPDSGMAAAETGGVMMRTATFFRALKSEQAKKADLERAKAELERLSCLSVEALAKDASLLVDLGLDSIQSVAMAVVPSTSARCLTVNAGQTHQFHFSESRAFTADQCHELLRRRAARGLVAR
jgi:serine/threonine-protein kinase